MILIQKTNIQIGFLLISYVGYSTTLEEMFKRLGAIDKKNAELVKIFYDYNPNTDPNHVLLA